MGILHQSDLNPSNVMLLDTWTTIFIWIGNDSSEDERENVQQDSIRNFNSKAVGMDS